MLLMKKIYLLICVGLLCCICGDLHAQSSETERIAQVRARLDTLILRDTTYLSEVDLSVGQVSLSELLRSVAQVGGVNLSVQDGANLLVSCNFSRARIADLILFLCEQYGLDIRVVGNIVSIFPYQAPIAPSPVPSIVYNRADSLSVMI